jgi:hypothetical protein
MGRHQWSVPKMMVEFANDKVKALIMRNKLIEKILKETPLETRVKVSIEAYFIAEYDRKCFEKSEPLLKAVLDHIKQWKDDGCP